MALGPASARPVRVAGGPRPTSRAVRVEWGDVAFATLGAPPPSPALFTLLYFPVFRPFCPQLPHLREPRLPGLRHLPCLAVRAECTLLMSLVPTGSRTCPLLSSCDCESPRRTHCPHHSASSELVLADPAITLVPCPAPPPDLQFPSKVRNRTADASLSSWACARCLIPWAVCHNWFRRIQGSIKPWTSCLDG